MNQHDKNTAMAELKKRGITKLTLSFSGGNDSGGVDHAEATKADGTVDKIDLFDGPHVGSNNKVWDHKDNVWREATDEEIANHKLSTLLTAPIFDEYYSFAGDFYVDGELIWDVEANTVTMPRSESVPTSYDREDVW